MRTKAVSGIVLMLLLTSMLSSAFIIQPSKAEPGLTESPWPMLFHDAQHTNRGEYIGPQTNETSWTYVFDSLQPLSYRGSYQPIIGPDGVIYFGVGLEDGSGRLYAIRPDGTLKWTSDLDVTFGTLGTPAISPDGTIYVGGYPNRTYALDSRDGSLKQTFPVGGELIIGPDGTLYITSWVENQLFAFRPDGTEKWRFRSPYLMPGTVQVPAIGLDGTVYVSYSGWWTATDMGGGSLYALNPETGDIKWSSGFSPSTSSPSIGADGSVYVFDSGSLYAFDSAGRMRWYTSSPSNWYSYPLGSPVIGSDGTIIVAGYSGYYGREHILRAFNPDGEVLWDFILPQQSGYYTLITYYGSTPIIDSNGNVFVLSRVVEYNFWAATTAYNKGVLLHSLDKQGKIKWSYYFPEPWYLASLPSIGPEGSLYVVIGKYKYPEPPDVVLHAFGPGPAPENKPPVASFTYTPYNPIVGEEITFDAFASYDLDGRIVSYEWDFDDGNVITTTDPIIAYAYGVTGTYAVKLTVTDDSGATSSLSKIVEVMTIEPNQSPSASFMYYPEDPKAGQWITFDASDSHDPDGQIVFYEWDWNNNGVFDDRSSKPKITYYWDISGTYTVGLRVTDNNGATHTTTKDVTVKGERFIERLKGIWPWSEKIREISEEEFLRIKKALNIYQYPYPYPNGNPDPLSDMSANPDSNVNFYWYSDYDLKKALNKELDQENMPGLTYGIYILNAIDEQQLIEYVWTLEYARVAGNYFGRLLDLNSNWAYAASSLAVDLIVSLLGEPYSTGVSTLLYCKEAADIFEDYLKPLKKLMYYNSLWLYLDQRYNGASADEAWQSVTTQPQGSYRHLPTRDEKVLSLTKTFFEHLWDTYGEYLTHEGLEDGFKRETKNRLREILYSVLQRHKPELLDWEIIGVKSPVELRVYDSQGNITGLVEGEVTEEIPHSLYGDQIKTVVIFWPSNSYRYEVIGTDEGTYELTVTSVAKGEAMTFTATDIPISTNAIHQYAIDWDALSLGEEGVTVMVDSDADGVFEYTFTSDSELTQSEYVIATDNTPPQTWLNIGEPKFVVNDVTYLTSATPIELIAEDNAGGSGVASTAYRIYNASYDSGWITYTEPFYLVGLSDGTYRIEYNSTDFAGNIEPTKTLTVILDNTGPSVTILNPPIGWALQDGVTFIASAIDSGSGAQSLNISIREANGAEGIFIGFENLSATYNAATDEWTLFFDTLLLPDGYYVVLARAKDNLGNIGPTLIVPYSIRNWAVIELLPASETNKAGRTMPVKFSLRVAASVDPNQPFVYNEELTIKIYAADKPSNILQTSTFGDAARDYRINTISQHYITNFQTLKTAKTYVVDIYRKGMLIDTFQFNTVK